ncbi:uncharacterized protein ACA1_377300 [Acanthamoeba castellanii str. Neff]|uniref:Uncharacterized protein n=1 Tax=Acanthamoeba castellanii (strain ATCC 30010 / Neff) TaxID=1257118 RepID=L8GU60_ACACF|nr:uncharacterized protein ACA1_377300 [Acanthamoeba castellanii str. Neff]ELR15626.1 hypothetical protein ACA1_377300 [Acanthamoeba castellanii str. Neff]
MKLPLLPRWKKHKPTVPTHTSVKKTTQAKKKAAIPVHLGAHTTAASSAPPAAARAAAQLAREKEAVERKRRATEADVDLSAVLPVPDTARAAHHHDCNDRDAWLAEHAYLVRLRAAATAAVASPMHDGSDACTATTTMAMSRSSPRRLIDDAPPY